MGESIKNLRKRIKKYFNYEIYRRGFDYYEEERIETMKINNSGGNKINVKGKIRGTDVYETGFIFDLETEKFGDFSCDCPYEDDCKHSAALALEFIDYYFEFSIARRNEDNLSAADLVQWMNEKLEKENKNGSGEDDLEYVDEYAGDLPENSWGSSKKSRLTKKQAENIYLILKQSYYGTGLSLSLRAIEKKQIEIKNILDNLEKFDQSKEELFKYIGKNASYGNYGMDAGKFTELLKKSGLKVFWETESHELFFSDNEKIEARLEKNESGWIVFKLKEKHKKQKPFKMYRCQNGIVKIENKNVGVIPLPEKIVRLLNRIKTGNEDYYGVRYGKPFETELEEDEILKLNDIIADCRRHLIFSSSLAEQYEIREFSETKPCVIIDYDKRKNFLSVSPAVDYDFEKIDVSKSVWRYRSHFRDSFSRVYENQKKYVIKLEDEKIFYAPIRKSLEINLYKYFYARHKQFGFKRNITADFEGEKEIFKFIRKFLPELEKTGYKIEYVRDELNIFEENFFADVTVDMDAENDWLSFDINCYCGEDKINLEILREFVKNGLKDGFLKLPDGRLWKITNHEELERLVWMLESFHKKEAGRFEGRAYCAPEVENIFANSKYYQAKMAESFKNFMAEAKSGRPVEPTALSEKSEKILRPYQKDGIDWLYFLRKYRFGGILADDMGLGKTLQALTLLQMNRVKGKPSIVVCPKTLLHNWKNEVEKFMPEFRVLILEGNPAERKQKMEKLANCDLIVISYATAQKEIENFEKKNLKFNYCLLDEAQFIKNFKTKNARAVKKINADYRLALTGTPLENGVLEIWSIFEFLMPGFLGNQKMFAERFENPIAKRGDKAALENLRNKIRCFMLRRAKGEVLKELPPKIEQHRVCELENSQSILYQEILANVRQEIFSTVKEKGFSKSQIHILAALTKLRQVCNHPVLLLKDKDHKKYESAKLNVFHEIIEEISRENRKILVFSQFTQMLDILAKELAEKRIQHCYLSGKTVNRHIVIDEFNNNPERKVFLISLKAGGTGLNLTAADNVIIFDPWWNPSVELQAIDRAHRIGQTKSVNVYRFIAKGTIEEKIVKLQERKKFLFDSLVGESRELFKKLTWEDVQELFR